MQHNNPNLFGDGAVHPSGGEPQKSEEEDEDEAPIDMSFPTDSPAKMVIYILSFPLMAPLYLTLPDMKNNEFTIFPCLKVPGIKHSAISKYFDAVITNLYPQRL